jgi:non-specific protein-tyrosine kinase
MQEVINTLREKAEVVIFDSPPVLAAADPLLLATLLDVVVVVVDSQVGRRSAFRRAVQSLQQADVTLMGTVINRAGQDRRRGYYGYGYGYYTSDNGAKPRGHESSRFRVLARIVRRAR